MISSLVLSVLLTSMSFTADLPGEDKPVRTEIRMGALGLTADEVTFHSSTEQSQKPISLPTFRCTLKGNAMVILGEDADEADIIMTADQIQIESTGSTTAQVTGTGNCRYKDSILAGKADQMRIEIANPMSLKFTGKATIQSGIGERKATLSAEEIIYREGRFHLNGAVTLTPSEEE